MSGAVGIPLQQDQGQRGLRDGLRRQGASPAVAKKEKETKMHKVDLDGSCLAGGVTGLALLQLCAGMNSVFTSRCQYNVPLLSSHEWRNWL